LEVVPLGFGMALHYATTPNDGRDLNMGAHSQGETLDELNANLREVITMLLKDGEPHLEAEFVGIQNVVVS